MKKITKQTTIRELLQEIGTEFRSNITNNVWVNSLMNGYKSDTFLGQPHVDWNNQQNYTNEENSNWIITDCRFPNELKAIKAKGGISIRINRLKEKKLIKDFGIIEHPSEIALDNSSFDYTIDNNGSIDDLIKQVKKILAQEKII